MQLRERILKDHSKANCDAIVKWVGHSQARFDELFGLFLHGEPVIIQRASWPMSYAVSAHPDLIDKHFRKLLDNLARPGIHDATKRNTIRLLQDVDIPEKFQGRVMDICFRYIADPAEKVAVKAFSLTVLDRLSKLYPEIRHELITIINDRWEFETAAFRARAKRILKTKKR